MYLRKSRTIRNVALSGAIPLVSSLDMGGTWQQRAKKRMEEKSITQADLIKPLRVKTRGSVGHYLTGRREPSPEQLLALARVLDVSLDWLLDNERTESTTTTQGGGALSKEAIAVAEKFDCIKAPADRTSVHTVVDAVASKEHLKKKAG